MGLFHHSLLHQLIEHLKEVQTIQRQLLKVYAAGHDQRAKELTTKFLKLLEALDDLLLEINDETTLILKQLAQLQEDLKLLQTKTGKYRDEIMYLKSHVPAEISELPEALVNGLKRFHADLLEMNDQFSRMDKRIGKETRDLL